MIFGLGSRVLRCHLMNGRTSIFTFILTSHLCLAFADPYRRTLASVNRSPDQSCKGHLNSDIGSSTPRTLKTKDSSSDGVGPSKGNKKLKPTSE